MKKDALQLNVELQRLERRKKSTTYLGGDEPGQTEVHVPAGAAHLVDLGLVRGGLGVLQPVDLRLIALDGRHLVAQHAQREQPEKDAFHHQKDHQEVVFRPGVALVALADAVDVLAQHQHHAVHARDEHPEHEQQEQLVVAHAHAVVHPTVLMSEKYNLYNV